MSTTEILAIGNDRSLESTYSLLMAAKTKPIPTEPPIETENDLEELTTQQIEDSVVFSTDWTAETISAQLQKGAIDLDPAFQRRDAWTPDRKSKDDYLA
jgi:hypothetical protein